MDFSLHPRLEADTETLADLPLCRALLMNDSRYPWVILVPRIPDIREIHQLSDQDQIRLLKETSGLSKAMERAFGADKINVAALGNMVPQLHIHVIARFASDSTWPAPVWGQGQAVPYGEALPDELERFRSLLPSL